jgi:hypothetical protein
MRGSDRLPIIMSSTACLSCNSYKCVCVGTVCAAAAIKFAPMTAFFRRCIYMSQQQHHVACEETLVALCSGSLMEFLSQGAQNRTQHRFKQC